MLKRTHSHKRLNALMGLPPVPPVAVPSAARLFELVRAGFGQRRKMLRGALRAELGDDAGALLAAAGIDGAARAETLTLAQWAALAREVGE